MRKLAQSLFVMLALSPLAVQDSHARARNNFGPAVDAFCVPFNNTRPYSEQKCVLCHNMANLSQKINPQWENWDEDNFAPFCNALPNSRIDQPATDVTVTKGAQVVFSGSAVDPDGPVPFAFLWNFPGGTPATSSNANAGTVTFNTGGVFTAAFTARDAQNRRDRSPATRRITVVDPACTDGDDDGYSPVGGSCGPVDCNDADPAINPAMSELCGDGVDNNCNGRIDTADSGCIRPQDCLAGPPPANRPPTTVADAFTAPYRTIPPYPAVILNVLANDSDPDTAADPTNRIDPATVFLSTNPNMGGTASANPDGTISYRPAVGFAGTETLRYKVKDTRGAQSEPGAFVRVTVTAPANRAPLAVNDSATAPLRTGPPYPAVIINVLANDSDPDTANDPNNRIDPATVFITVAPTMGGTASANPDGTVSYRPAVGFTGTETFRYKVRDTQGLAAEIGGIVSVTVGP